MGFSGSSFWHHRKARSDSYHQKLCACTTPWLNHFCTSGFLVVIGNWMWPVPFISHGFSRGPVSNASETWECPCLIFSGTWPDMATEINDTNNAWLSNCLPLSMSRIISFSTPLLG